MDEIKLFPVCGWTIGPIKAYEAVTVRLDYLTSPMQLLPEAIQSPQFVLTAPQASELAEALNSAVRKLQTSEFQAAPDPKH
jgi:hypothetical protein